MRHDHSLAAVRESVLVSPNGYYAWRARQSNPGPPALECLALAKDIKVLHSQSRQTYGRPRIQEALLKEGRRHERTRVARLMQADGLCIGQKGRYRVRTSDSNHDHPIAISLAEAPNATGPNQIWLADITHIQTRQGWLYLAAILDLYSRKIVGWAERGSIDTALVLDALSMALLRRNPPPNLLFHSDRGVQYSSGDFRAALTQANLIPSMSRKGNCYDNATMESFWSSFKPELICGRDFASHSQARSEAFDYIECFYNPPRSHRSLNSMPLRNRKRGMV